uniref:Ribosomal protein L14 n=1 Tax=Microspora stagnorum TaxID=163317 RepID=U5YE15_MICSG|nr:ribosomal protein L14 [Microspora stagnorum]AGZ90334.1 ribosomal protein L14 [Microspora stagnorum]
MISVGTFCEVCDNSGVKLAQCIKIPGHLKRAIVGQMIVVAIQKGRLKKEKDSAIKGKGVYQAIIVQTKKAKSRLDGSHLKWDNNALILLQKGLPIGSRILKGVGHELRKKRHTRLISLAPRIC